jgi:uncharacterized protein (TIGR02996 family)
MPAQEPSTPRTIVTMTTQEAFLQAIGETPQDDTPRLVFADWLEEQGQAQRAEFIRIQPSSSATPGADERGGAFGSAALPSRTLGNKQEGK